jgi:hypothetical protein
MHGVPDIVYEVKVLVTSQVKWNTASSEPFEALSSMISVIHDSYCDAANPPVFHRHLLRVAAGATDDLVRT